MREFFELNEGLAVSRSLLGWALHGTSYRDKEKVYAVSGADESSTACDAACLAAIESEQNDAKLDDLIKHFFEMEAIGVVKNKKSKGTQERAMEILEKTSRFNGDSWETGLLWNSDIAPNVDSRSTALRRMNALERKLDRDPICASLFYKEMDRIIEQGYAVKVDKNAFRPRVWYVPVCGVYNINKPNKVRIVYDCAAPTKGVSFNSQVDAGPDLLKPLPGILIRFRQYEVAMKGDISDMFLRVKVIERDRAVRFLYRGSRRTGEPEEFEATCLIFGAKSSPTSAIFIKNKNAERYADTKPNAVQGIIDDSYMDDLISSQKSEEAAIEFVRDVVKINSEAGFKMHGWASNRFRVLEQALGLKKPADKREMSFDDADSDRVLGMGWDMETDELKFNVKLAKVPIQILNGEKVPTKREVLCVIMSIYDPLGLIIPFSLKSKVLMQSVHRSGINWDNKLREEEHASWLAWLSEIEQARQCRVPRCYTPSGTDENATLHIFCDASLKAFAAAAYLRFENQDGTAHLALVMGKSRAVTKPETVPRLELQAALLGARLAKFLKGEIRITIKRRIFWSDSSTIIQWIRSEPREHNIFVANRLGEIAELTNSSEWKWVPTKENPADDATRTENDALKRDSRWFNGPDFLRRDESAWPTEKFLTRQERNTIRRIEPAARVNVFSAFTITTKLTELSISKRLLGWSGLLVHAQRLRQFITVWRQRAHSSSRIDRIREAHARWKSEVSLKSFAQRVRDNENYLYRVIQAECFEPEFRALSDVGKVNKQSKIAMLNPHLDDDGILRAHGRATVMSDYCNNDPIILDGKHPAVKLLVAHYHRKYYHGSSNTVVNELRQHYYVIGLRGVLRSLASRCVVCRLRRGRARAPLMAALPEGRVAARSRPFSHCGVDYFGPMFVKIGRRREKLFTCLTVRAIHLEIAYTLNTNSAINALRRLASRRGSPLVLYSDNGTNFRGASEELADVIAQLDREKIAESAMKRNIQWRFNAPDAPHMRGAWERLIRSVKTALHTILKDQAPSEEVLYTVLTEIDHSVNSRPLTHISLDPRDDEALTPNHFLIGSSSGNFELGKYNDKNLCLRKEWKLAQHYADAFWKRWLREYLPNLLPRNKWTENEEPLKVGDIVLIMDLSADRNFWKRGTITQVFPGVDGQVRVAEVRTPMGIFSRPAHKLIRLLSINES